MVALITVRKDNKVVGRCDAKCYEAQHPDCTCICQGANHGAGFDQAQENTEQMAEQWIAEYAAERGLEEYESQVARFGKQLSLF